MNETVKRERKQEEKTCPDCGGSGEKIKIEIDPIGMSIFGFALNRNVKVTCSSCLGRGTIKTKQAG